MDKILNKIQTIVDRLEELDKFLDHDNLTDEQIYFTLSELKSLDVQLAFLKESYDELLGKTNPTDIGGC